MAVAEAQEENQVKTKAATEKQLVAEYDKARDAATLEYAEARLKYDTKIEALRQEYQRRIHEVRHPSPKTKRGP